MSVFRSHTRPEPFELISRTGQHVVADLFCVSCDTLLGWMYISAPNGHEKYKEGVQIIISLHRITDEQAGIL